MDRFNNILKKKHPHLAKKKVLFYQNNAQVHMCPALMAKFKEFRLLPHPAYLPKLAPDYFLFPNIRRKKIHHQRALTETEAYFEGLDKSYYSDGLKKLKDHWIK